MSRSAAFDPNRCDGFDCRKSVPGDGLESVADKIARFREASNGMLCFVVDWDDTIAPGTWPILRSLLPDDMRRLHQSLYKQHSLQQREDTLSHEAAEGWQRAAVGMLVGLPLSSIEAKAAEVEIRPGAREIFDMCDEEGVPIIVKTGSVKQFVKAAAVANGIAPSLIVATDLKEENDIVTGWEPQSLSHSVNKGRLEHPYLPLFQRQMSVIIGDGLADRNMVPPEHDALLIRANGGFEDPDQIARSFNVDRPYDVVALESNLIATAGLATYILGR